MTVTMNTEGRNKRMLVLDNKYRAIRGCVVLPCDRGSSVACHILGTERRDLSRRALRLCPTDASPSEHRTGWSLTCYDETKSECPSGCSRCTESVTEN